MLIDVPGEGRQAASMVHVYVTVYRPVVVGLVGVLAGLVLGRLAGVSLLLFGTPVDVFLVRHPPVADGAFSRSTTPS